MSVSSPETQARLEQLLQSGPRLSVDEIAAHLQVARNTALCALSVLRETLDGTETRVASEPIPAGHRLRGQRGRPRKRYWIEPATIGRSPVRDIQDHLAEFDRQVAQRMAQRMTVLD